MEIEARESVPPFEAVGGGLEDLPPLVTSRNLLGWSPSPIAPTPRRRGKGGGGGGGGRGRGRGGFAGVTTPSSHHPPPPGVLFFVAVVADVINSPPSSPPLPRPSLPKWNWIEISLISARFRPLSNAQDNHFRFNQKKCEWIMRISWWRGGGNGRHESPRPLNFDRFNVWT